MGTKRASFKDSEEYKKGHAAELRIVRMLKSCGWHVIPSYEYSGAQDDKPPQMQGPYKGLVLPDLDVCKDANRRWVEVKWKATCPMYYKNRRLQHGFDRRHYEHYMKVQDISGTTVWLFIWQEDTQELLTATLDNLAWCVQQYHGDKMGRSGMVFFPRDEFTVGLDTFNGATATPLPKRTNLVTVRKPKDSGQGLLFKKY